MSGKRASYGITKQHGEHLRDVLKWLAVQPDATPLEIGVLEEVTGRVEHRALQGSLLRVRIKNRGNPRGSTGVRYPAPLKMDDATWHGGGLLWSVEEMDTLARLCREEKTLEEMHEFLPHRTSHAISHQLKKMGLRARVESRAATHNEMRTRDGRGVLARAREVRARRKESEREERRSA
jgi:hypothetical protein